MTEAYSPVGANYAATSTTCDFKLGGRSIGADGTEWIYVQASGAITQYDCVGVDENFQAAAVTSTIGGAAWLPGFAQVAFADNEYGWVATKGSNISVRAKSAVPDSQLYVGTSGTAAGVVVSTSATGRVALNGVVLVTTASAGTAEAIEILATHPFFTA